MTNPNKLSRDIYRPAPTGDLEQVLAADSEKAEQKRKDRATKAALAQKAFQATVADRNNLRT